MGEAGPHCKRVLRMTARGGRTSDKHLMLVRSQRKRLIATYLGPVILACSTWLPAVEMHPVLHGPHLLVVGQGVKCQTTSAPFRFNRNMMSGMQLMPSLPLQDTFSVVESPYVVRSGDGIWLRRGAFPRVR